MQLPSIDSIQAARIFIPDTVTVVNDHELMIIDPAVVEDAGGRTFDPCLNTSDQSPNGAWTFKTLMMSIRNGSVQQAEQMLSDWLLLWENQETVNGFSVPIRTGMGPANGNAGLFAVWPRDESGNLCTIQGVQQACLSLTTAPVRLNAIVNRIDLGGLPNQPANGELRFIFGVSASEVGTCSSAAAPLFNIILEFGVPQNANIPSINAWANDWNALQNLSFTDESFQTALQAMTNFVVTPGACPSNPNGSCISQIRTNELELQPSQGKPGTFWEQRQFHLNPQLQQNSELVEAMISQTPDGSFTGFSGGNFGAPACSTNPSGPPPVCTSNSPVDVTAFITANQPLLDNGTYVVPPCFGSQTDQPPCPSSNPAFLGGSVFNLDPVATAYWNGDPTSFQHKERVIFSEGTCNGCHGAETAVHFQQVVNRLPGHESVLSSFLVGCDNNGTLPHTTILKGKSECVCPEQCRFGNSARSGAGSWQQQ